MASEANRKIAEKVADAFGGRPRVIAHHDTDGTVTVHVATRVDSPTPGVNSYSTLGLSDTPLIQDGKEFGTRVELLTACDADAEYFDRALGTVAFCIIKGGWFCAPGCVFPNIFNFYDPDTAFPHVYFSAPYLWEKENEEKLRTMHLPEKVVSFLQVIPISESERQYLVQHGDDALETLLAGNDVDVGDLSRKPVV